MILPQTPSRCVKQSFQPSKLPKKSEESRDQRSPRAPSQGGKLKSSGCIPSVALLSYFETLRGETDEDITLSVIRETISMPVPLRLRANFAHSHMRIAADIFRQPDTSDHPSHPWSCRRVKKFSIVWRFRSRLPRTE